jgi:DNA-binding response OmpR family regulator
MNRGWSTGFLEEIKFPQGCEISPHVPTVAPSLPDPSSEIVQGARILIAEDDPVSCEILASRLQKWGYDTVITRNGQEAMTVMRSNAAPSLAILDWMMPGMDGIEVCRRLREVNKAVYIIFLTSLGTKENVLQALEAGADDFLLKPFDAFALQTRVRVGLRIIGLQTTLAARVKELEATAAELDQIKGRLQLPM